MRTCPYCGEAEMTERQRAVLDTVTDHGPITATDIALLLETTRADVRDVLRLLMAAGMVARTPGGGNQHMDICYWRTVAKATSGRMCAHQGCTTPLSRYNHGRYCGAHERGE